MYKQVPTWDKSWTTTTFSSREDFRDFLIPLFKEPGQYQFDDTSFLFDEQARLYNKNKAYCFSPLGTKDFVNYWDDQKDKCRNGVIFHSGNKTWYLPREYYMWINFLPIFDKVEQQYGFAKVWDSQYHTALYELLAELHYKHVAIVKKRQWGNSYFHCAKLINHLWFEQGITMKMGASHKDYVNDKGNWKFLEEYRSFLNEHTAWYRPMTPGKVLLWQQQIPVKKGNKTSMRGNKGVIQGLTFDKSATSGVGGGIRFFYYEEAGIAPTMHTTVEYLFPAMKAGHITTGQFIGAGSVGDLDHCEPLKRMIYYPEICDIYPVNTNLIDDKGTIGTSGLFIPEQWSMPPYIDQYGNSLVEEALKALDEQFIQWKKDLPPETYQLRVSQHPRYIAEAFAFRRTAIFPMHLVNAQQRRIDEKTYPFEFVDLSRDVMGKIIPELSNRLPIMEFPITTNRDNKEGVLVVWERPRPDTEFGTYYASIDPVSEGKTLSSDSLCSIHVYKNAVEVTKVVSGEPTTSIERGSIVAAWCGRYDDITKTHAQLEMIVEWYNAWALVENNISLFIQYMIHRKKQRYLVPKAQFIAILLKDMGAAQNIYQDYGWKNSGQIFKSHLLSYGIEYLKEELDIETKPDGTIIKTTYGVERIPDPMLLKEMAAYQPDLNVDRLVSYCALIAFVKVQESNRGLRKRVEYSDDELKKTKNLYINNKNMFHNIGNTSTSTLKRPSRNPFHNLK